IILLFLGATVHIRCDYIAIPFGLAFMSVVLEIFKSRRDLLYGRGGPVRAGSSAWKGTLIILWSLGAFVMFMGALPLFKLLPQIMILTSIALCVAIVALMVAVMIHRARILIDKNKIRIDAIKTAESYIFYVRTAQAIQ